MAYGGGKPVFNEFVTPIGLIVHLYHDTPQLKTTDQYGKEPDIDKDTGLQKAEFKVTLAWDKSASQTLSEIVALANKTKGEAWPDSIKPGAFFNLEPFFRDGDNPAHNTKNRDYLRNRIYLNFKSKAQAKLTNPQAPPGPNNPVIYSGAPGLLGPYGPEDKIMPSDLWAGCTGRVSGVMFGTEYAGRNFISTRLNNIQKYDEGDGTRIGGAARPTPESQFGALKQMPAGGLGALGIGQQAISEFANQQGKPDPFGMGANKPNMFL